MKSTFEGPDMIDDTPELRKQQVEKLLEFFETSGLLAKINTFQQRQSFLQNVKVEDAEEMLKRINGILVGMPIHQRKTYGMPGIVYDDQGERVYVPPMPSTQKFLFEELIIPELRKTRFPDSAEIMATQINLLHLFPDGNGRLARLIYYIFSSKLKIDRSDEALMEIADVIFDRNKSLNFNPNIIMPELNDVVEKMSELIDPEIRKITGIVHLPPLQPTNSEKNELPQDNKEVLITYINNVICKDPFDVAYGLKYFLFKRRTSPWDFINKEGYEGKYAIDCEKLIESINSKEEVNSIIEYLDLAKVGRARAVFEIYSNSELFKSRRPDMNAKEFYQASVKYHFENGTNIGTGS